MSKTLIEHAAYELTKAGMANNTDPEARQAATNTLALVRRIEKMNMTDRQAQFVLEAFSILTQFLPLTPITDDPEEWEKFEIDRKNVDTGEVEKREVWQSRRATSIFSEDKGKTFTDQRTGKTGTSVDHLKQAEEEKATEEARAKTKADKKSIKEAMAEAPAAEVNAAPATTPDVNETPETVDNAKADVNETEETK